MLHFVGRATWTHHRSVSLNTSTQLGRVAPFCSVMNLIDIYGGRGGGHGLNRWLPDLTSNLKAEANMDWRNARLLEQVSIIQFRRHSDSQACKYRFPFRTLMTFSQLMLQLMLQTP
jgi:hypothetical protein